MCVLAPTAGPRPAAASAAGGAPPQTAGGTAASVERRIEAQRIATTPTIDGLVENDEWRGAAVATGFIQFEPARGEPGTRRTEALVTHDDVSLYVAFRVWDDEDPTARLTRRDADLLSDDAVFVLLDSHLDRQSAYLFGTNLLGTQTDGRVANDGRTVDADWDGTWQAAAAPTDYGWSAELVIPLSSIKYKAGEDVSWGINFGRSRRRSLELSFWAGPLENRFRVSQAGTITGLDVPAPARRHQIVPYGLSRFQDGERSDWDVGVDARFELTPATSAFGTLYPDFATIEADQERVNLTRFEVSLREKRQFFLEGGELFRQRIRTFYSRRIAEIKGGVKLLGKIGPWTVATLYARSEPLEEDQSADYSVVRLQRDIGRSNIAFMVANRGFEDEQAGSAGLDATLFFTETFGMTAQLIESYGSSGNGSMAYFIRPSYDSATGHFHVRYTHLGDRFADNANVIGFIRDDDRRELDSAVEKTFWLAEGVLERVQYDSNYNIYWGQDATLRSWQIDESIELELRNRWSGRIAYQEEFKRFEKSFQNRQLGFEVGYNTREFESIRAGYRFGRSFDADFDLWTAAAARKLTPELSIEYELQRLLLDPDPEDETTWIHVVRANQFFTPDLFVKVFFQTNSAIDRRNVQAVFVYRYQPPFGTLQVAYQRGTAEFGQRSEQGNTLFLKATTVF